MTGVLRRDTQGETHREEKKAYEDRQRLDLGSHKPRHAQSQQKLEEARRKPPLGPEEGTRPCRPIDFRLRKGEEHISADLSHPVCNNLLH